MTMNKNKLTDEISDAMRELFETTEQNMISRVNSQLVDGMKSENGSEWQKIQNRKAKKLKELLKKDGIRSKKLIIQALEKASVMADFNPNKIIKDVEKRTDILIASAMREYQKQKKQVLKLEKTRPLEKAIFQQTQQGIQDGIPVFYKNKRKVGYKEYMEMNVRTTVQHEIGDRQLDAGSDANIVFYIVNEFADCADDHADYQGKVYYDQRFMSFNLNDEIKKRISSHIRKHRMKSVQQVRDKEPFLTTRPNCRHTLTAISIDQALGESTDSLLKELRLKSASYRPKNYEALQEQRRNERTIRHYKARKEMNEKLYAQSGSEYHKQQVAHDRALVTKWQKRQRSLLNSNPHLERDYRRETKKVLVQDLGAKYNLKKP